MSVDFFGNEVRCETGGNMVSLNDLFNAGNAWRLNNKKPIMQMAAFLNSLTLREYIEAAATEWNTLSEDFIKKTGKGKYTRTMCHISVAILAAEQISPAFHARVHKTFVEGKLLEFRELGGTEFKNLNSAIDLYLPDRTGKDNRGVYITIAKKIRSKLLGIDAESEDWNKATVPQIHSRYDLERRLVDYLSMGMVKDFEQLKNLIDRM